MSEKDPKIVLAYDLGGTKVAVGAVNSQGKVLDEIRVPVVINEGKAAVMRQLGDLGKKILARYPKIRRAGMASAGPLDPTKGVLLDPTNFSGPSGTWGQVPITKLISKHLKIPVSLENDAAAAVLAERWVGCAKGKKNIVLLTLGTGLGTGIIVNGELVRARGGLHPEAGHLIIHQGDQTAPCGCGNLGCAEAFLSGRGFTRRNRPRFANPDLTAIDIAKLARNRDPRALAAFEEYAVYMAVALHNYAVIYAPELVVFTGSFAETADLFMDSTLEHLEKLLARRRIGFDLMPKLKVSKLDNQAGLVGGGYVAMHSAH
jgi:glucokinase